MTSKVDSGAETILKVVRGGRPWSDLYSLGMTGRPEKGSCQFPAAFPGDTRVTVRDLARGLLTHLRDGPRLQEWAVLMEALPYDLVDAESHPEGQTVLDALWSASFGDPLGEEAIGVVTHLANESAN
jgi:hypothetical protein